MAGETGKLDWKRRLVAERDELQAKLQSLTAFLDSKEYKKLSEMSQRLLNMQHRHMMEYYEVLGKRIIWSNVGENNG